MKRILFYFTFLPLFCISQGSFQIATLKYNGGGDWYANPTALPNLIEFANKNLGTDINNKPATVEVGSIEIFNYPFIHMTGHGNVVFTKEEAENLRNYLLAGGFLHIDDNYGMDKFIRKEIDKVFPENKLVRLGNDHPIFHQKYKFDFGLPKIHQHNANPAEALAIVYNGRLVCLYTFESDLGDGWEDYEVHQDSEETRLKALKMGANILNYVFNQPD